jgi:hypothetical protein
VGVEGAEKTSKIVENGLTGTDAIIGTSWALKDLQCQDYVSGKLHIMGSISTTIGLVLGNIFQPKKYTL